MMHSNFKKIGNNVTISPKASIYGAERIEIGDNVRIDDFCILSAGEGGIKIGSNIHIACYSSLIGSGPIMLMDRTQISQRVTILSSTDDFTGAYLVGPCVPKHLTNVRHAEVILSEDTVVGAGSVILPGVIVGQNTAIGAMSLVKHDVPENVIYAGIPAKFKGNRVKRDHIGQIQNTIDYFSYQPGE